jgi:GPR1/FUN34/yaaH family
LIENKKDKLLATRFFSAFHFGNIFPKSFCLIDQQLQKPKYITTHKMTLGNPAPFGLLCFGMTTAFLMYIELGWCEEEFEISIVGTGKRYTT